MQMSTRFMRMLLLFRMGTHSLPIVLGRHSGITQDQHLQGHLYMVIVMRDTFCSNALPCRL